ncbi:MAG: bifunctional pyr operon transcriptional regulator/uracil phosphoribosyltransferase PyrR [Rothia dentocariosa]
MPGSTVPTSGTNQGQNLTEAPHLATPQGTSEETTTVGRTILSEDEIRRALTRIAYEIIETNKGVENLVLIGIRSRGVPLAVRLAARIQAIEPNFNAETRLGALDITAYRDDQRTGGTTSPETAGESIMPSIGIEGKTVVLVDDVLYSGRTVRAALDALNAHGRPALVRLAVLVDRGHRQLPIRADHVGKNLPTSALEKVRVVLEETDNATDRVDIIQLEGQLS